MKKFTPIPLTEVLDKETIEQIQSSYTGFEKVAVKDLYISEPNMQGASDIQKAAAAGTSHVTVLQETILPKNRRGPAWSREFIDALPASMLMPLALKCHQVVMELFKQYYPDSEEDPSAEKKR